MTLKEMAFELKTLWKKQKMLKTSVSSFSDNISHLSYNASLLYANALKFKILLGGEEFIINFSDAGEGDL